MSISNQLINGFLKSELALFKKHYEDTPVSELQEDRGLSIAWICYYFNERISTENLEEIVRIVEEVYSRGDYQFHGWFRISALEAAAYIITSEIHYHNNLIGHLSCGQSWARGFMVESASIICPLLNFKNNRLKSAIELNLVHNQAYCEQTTLLYLSTRGESEEKKQWLENLILSDEAGMNKVFCIKLKNAGDHFSNGYFIGVFNRIKSYIISKILLQPVMIEPSHSLFDTVESGFSDFLKLEKEHPLNRRFFDLHFLK